MFEVTGKPSEKELDDILDKMPLEDKYILAKKGIEKVFGKTDSILAVKSGGCRRGY